MEALWDGFGSKKGGVEVAAGVYLSWYRRGEEADSPATVFAKQRAQHRSQNRTPGGELDEFGRGGGCPP
jgi:hypothetical protein